MSRIASLFVFFLLSTFAFNASAEEITVSAAASLKEAFTDAKVAFEKKHPKIKVNLNFGGSGMLAQQILNGAPVDVFASADTFQMQRLQNAKLTVETKPKYFAVNNMVVIVPKDSKLIIDKLPDLVTNTSIKRIAIANPDSVPAGRYAKHVLNSKNVYSKISDKLIFAQDVRQVLDYVARGEVDLGFVYTTDAKIMKDRVKTLPKIVMGVRAEYPIAVISTSKSREAAKQFVKFVRKGKGQKIINKYGFQKYTKAKKN